ncbi:MAG TPA: nuclear transport factor 2 family protein [Caulobacteraceae bacterium]
MRSDLAAFAVTALVVLAPASGRAETPDPNAREVERFFMQGIGHFNRHELEPFLKQFSPDLRMFAVTEWLRGKEQIRARFTQTFRDYPNVRMEITNLKGRSEAANVVTVEFEFHTYPTGSGGAWHGVGSGVYVKTAEGWREVLEHESVTKRDAGMTPPVKR